MMELSAIGLSVGIVCLFVGLLNLLSVDGALATRLRQYAVPSATPAAPESLDEPGAVVGKVAGRVDRAIIGRSFVASLRADLARANLRLTPGEFLLIQAALTFALMLIGYDVVALVAQPNLFALPVFGLIGFGLPRLWLLRRAGARLKAFSDQLPDTITLMANALRSGMSLLQAMDMVAREAAPPMSEEFGRVVREIGLGVGPEEALRHLKRRVRSEDVELLVTAMNVQSQVGGNLAILLDGIADTMRERIQLKGEVRTLTTQQRVSGYVLAFMPVVGAVLMLLINPDYMRPLFNMPWLILPIVGLINVFIGFLVIQQIIKTVEI
jgi:tight adherence protein B